MNLHRLLALAILSVSLTTFTPDEHTSSAHVGATGIVKERMDAMSAIGQAMKTIGGDLKSTDRYDLAGIALAAEKIAAHGGQAMTELFPAGSLKAPSEASPAIWTDWTRFSEIASELQASALRLQSLAEQNSDRAAVAEAFGTLGRTCKSCHEGFRIRR